MRLTLACFLCAALATGAVADPKADAKARVDKAAQHYGAGEFEQALVELEAAYALDSQPGLLYSIAQVHVKLERCEQAITFYTRFIDSGPEAKAKAAAQEAITVCKSKLGTATPEPAPTPAPAPPPAPVVTATVEPAPAVQPVPERPESPRVWYADPLGGVLVGAGAAGGIIGIVLYTSARGDVDAAESAASYDASEKLMDNARSKRTYAAIAGVAGVALVGAGVVRYMLVRGRTSHSVAVAPTVDGAAIIWSGRF